jgi:hypothetical protein
MEAFYMRLVLILISLFPLLVDAQSNPNLQSELVNMARVDQSIRQEVGEAGWSNAPRALLDKLANVDKKNTERLKEIFAKKGWVNSEQVGKKGVSAAFLIIQHSPDTEFQKRMLPKIKQSYLADEGISGEQVALLTDRVYVRDGKQQIYGTQARVVSGEIMFEPIKDPETVDERRAEMNMSTLSTYKKLLEEAYGM